MILVNNLVEAMVAKHQISIQGVVYSLEDMEAIKEALKSPIILYTTAEEMNLGLKQAIVKILKQALIIKSRVHLLVATVTMRHLRKDLPKMFQVL